MNQFLVNRIRPFYADDEPTNWPTKEQELALLDYMFINSAYLNQNEYCKQHIDLEDAAIIAATNPKALAYWREHADDSVVTDFVIDRPEVLAQHLAVSHPHLATQLLDELLYWRDKGRV